MIEYRGGIMKQAVIVKGNINRGAKGITVILDKNMPFRELQKCVAEKFRELSAFLEQSRMAVAFEGRGLTPAQEQSLLDIITENSGIEILYLWKMTRIRKSCMHRNWKLPYRCSSRSRQKICFIKEHSDPARWWNQNPVW